MNDEGESSDVVARVRPAPLAPHLDAPTPRVSTAHPALGWCCAAAGVVAVLAVIARWWGDAPCYAAGLVVIMPVLVRLAAVDIASHRLPNRLNGLLAVLTASVLTVSAGVDDAGPQACRRAIFGAVVLGFVYLVLALLGGGSGMGLGDVKLAPSLGALLAWPGWDVWLTGACSAFLLGGVWGVVLMARGQGRSARMPFGPFMIAGALAAVCGA